MNVVTMSYDTTETNDLMS